ncbi:MAG: four helix bundle protein [Chitinivibrionales bacterium]|nr:four helix bundle protein [Chitinivibrionales bacterium]
MYKVTGTEKFSRDFGLKDQIQRSSVSVVSNIAEGYDRTSKKEFLHFLSISSGSLAELRTQLEIAQAIGYIKADEFKLLDESCCYIGKMLTNLKKSRRT